MSGMTIRPRVDPAAPSRFHSAAEITAEVEQRFLEALAEFGVVTHAAGVCGMTRRGLYKRRQRDPEFADRWDEAVEAFEESLTYRVVQTALHMGTGQWVPAVDPDTGEPELDGEFEPLMRFDCSNVDPRIAVKLMALRMRSVNDPVTFSVQNNSTVINEEPRAPRLVTDDNEDVSEFVDARFEEVHLG